MPDFLRRIHTPWDTSEHLSEGPLRLASGAVYRMVVDLDRAPSPPVLRQAQDGGYGLFVSSAKPSKPSGAGKGSGV